MYDRRTSSLWSTLHGEPVIGPLVGKGIRLRRRAVVTSTWGAWKRLHPKTSVLSLDTGHQRDYDEGAAYRSYFATDRKMFITPEDDKRLPNKREVVALRSPDLKDPVAIDTVFLAKHPIYQMDLGNDSVVILTTRTGESRVYQSGDARFRSWNEGTEIRDAQGEVWHVREAGLIHTESKRQLRRYPSHQSFWFGWHAQFPETRLIR